jgi:hypothetical protein
MDAEKAMGAPRRDGKMRMSRRGGDCGRLEAWVFDRWCEPERWDTILVFVVCVFERPGLAFFCFFFQGGENGLFGYGIITERVLLITVLADFSPSWVLE